MSAFVLLSELSEQWPCNNASRDWTLNTTDEEGYELLNAEAGIDGCIFCPTAPLKEPLAADAACNFADGDVTSEKTVLKLTYYQPC